MLVLRKPVARPEVVQGQAQGGQGRPQGGQGQVRVPQVHLLGHERALKAEIWHVRGVGHKKACGQARGGQGRAQGGQGRPKGGQGQVGVSQVHLLSHGEGMES